MIKHDTTEPPMNCSHSSARRRILAGVCAGGLALGLVFAGAGVASADTGADTGTDDGSMSVQADKATQLHMSITNDTPTTLYLASADHSGTGVHWQDRALDVLAPGATESVSAYAAGDAEINLAYWLGNGTNPAKITLHGETPLVGSNQASGTSTDPSYTVRASPGSGYNPTDTYSIQTGGTFDYTGHTQTYTVPAGVSQLKLTLDGASGGMIGSANNTTSTGAEVSGTLAVTPGEVLTIGAGGVGGIEWNNYWGGWGMKVGGDDYSGGTGAGGSLFSAGGGGATVVTDGSGAVVAVAGGGGGSGATAVCANKLCAGGRGGYDGSWTGENGVPWPGGGGQAGAADTTKGQSQASPGSDAGGAGGGGAKGGLAGATGIAAGGGAGSSSAPGLTGATVTTAHSSGGNEEPGSVTIAPVS